MIKYKDTIVSKNSETFSLMESLDKAKKSEEKKEISKKLDVLHKKCEEEFHKYFPKEDWVKLTNREKLSGQ